LWEKIRLPSKEASRNVIPSPKTKTYQEKKDTSLVGRTSFEGFLVGLQEKDYDWKVCVKFIRYLGTSLGAMERGIQVGGGKGFQRGQHPMGACSKGKIFQW